MASRSGKITVGLNGLPGFPRIGTDFIFAFVIADPVATLKRMYIIKILFQKAGIFFLLSSLVLACQAFAQVRAAQEKSAQDTVPKAGPPIVDEFNTSIGYNLKVTVETTPVYKDSALVSQIIDRLPKNSVVGVLAEYDTWYKIEYGPEEKRTQGWVISFGVERTHELEHVVAGREEVSRWAGQKLIVTAGETMIRSFPASGAEVLARAYRNEIFDIAGESQDYYMVTLSNAVRGWVWKADVEIYVQPKYTKEQVREMLVNSQKQSSRLEELQSLLKDLGVRRNTAKNELQILEKLMAVKMTEAERLKTGKKSFFQYDSLKHRTSLHGFLERQVPGSKLGLGPTMTKGIGISFFWSEKLTGDFSFCSGTPTLRKLLATQPPLPASLTGFDTLNVSLRYIQIGVRYTFGKLKGFPILSKMNNHLYLGLGRMSLKPTAAGLGASQNLLGPVIGWGVSSRLFKRLGFEAGLRFFPARAEVTDVRSSGKSMLAKKKVIIVNQGLFFGVKWNF